MNIISKLNTYEVSFLIYLTIINLLSFILFGIDKGKAKRKKWRISEMFLIGLSILGGSIGSLIGMVIFKHKLSKGLFCKGIPLIIIINMIVALIIFNYIR